MYLIDTNVISEARKRTKAHHGVTRFFEAARASGSALYISVITIGEIRRGIELKRILPALSALHSFQSCPAQGGKMTLQDRRVFNRYSLLVNLQ